MLTGDNERTAEKVAAELKIDSVYAELMPEDKVQLLEEFLAMTAWKMKNWRL